MPDLNRDPVSSVWRAGPQPRSHSMSQDKSERMSEKGCQKEVQKECLRKDVRKKWGELEVVEDITSMMFDSQLSPFQVSCAVLL